LTKQKRHNGDKVDCYCIFTLKGITNLTRKWRPWRRCSECNST